MTTRYRTLNYEKAKALDIPLGYVVERTLQKYATNALRTGREYVEDVTMHPRAKYLLQCWLFVDLIWDHDVTPEQEDWLGLDIYSVSLGDGTIIGIQTDPNLRVDTLKLSTRTLGGT